jgi:transcriptional regulator with XRE-family HTH domain
VRIAQQFGRNLVACRKAAGLSQEELAVYAGLHRTHIGMIEKGARLPRIDTLVKLAGSLEVTPGELLAGISWRPAEPSRGGFATVPEPEQ